MIVLQKGFVVDPSQGIAQVMDILVDQGRIVALADHVTPPEGAEVIDATGKVVMPGLIDLHVHLREPGLEYKETVLSGCQAAVHGGFTTVVSMPNTQPVVDQEAIVESIIYKAKSYGYAEVLPSACVTKHQDGKELTEMGLLQAAGAIAFTDDGKTVTSTAMMRRAMEYSKWFNGLLISHCEDPDLLGSGVMNEGIVSTELGLAGIPNAVEDLIIARDLMLAKLTNARVHIAHLSTGSGLALIKQAKAEGVKVTAEVTPHHLFLTDEAVRGYDTNTKVNPPLRTAADNQALIQGLKEGSIDCISTDHAPHAQEDKEVEYDYAANGISGLETALPLVWSNLYEKGILSLNELVEKMSLRPATILGVEKGTLQVGRDADILVIDPMVSKVVKVEDFYSKGKNSPFQGLELRGWPDLVIKSGKVVLKDGQIQ